MRDSLTRRAFLKGAATAAFGFGAVPRFLLNAAASGVAARGRTLVVLFLRGAVDALHVAPPWSDPHYRRLRPRLALAEPGGEGEAALDLDGRFGLHP